MFIIDYLRKRALKRNRSGLETGILPMRAIHTAVALIDVEDTSCEACKNAVTAFYRENGIKGEIIYFDFRRIDDEERLITGIANTILKKDLNFYGKPSKEKVSLMFDHDTDLLISLMGKDSFTVEFMANCIRSRFKIGRRQLPGNVFDIVFADTDSSGGSAVTEAEILKSIINFLGKVK